MRLSLYLVRNIYPQTAYINDLALLARGGRPGAVTTSHVIGLQIHDSKIGSNPSTLLALMTAKSASCIGFDNDYGPREFIALHFGRRISS